MSHGIEFCCGKRRLGEWGYQELGRLFRWDVGTRLFFRPFGACPISLGFPTACAVGCILSPLRGLADGTLHFLKQNLVRYTALSQTKLSYDTDFSGTDEVCRNEQHATHDSPLHLCTLITRTTHEQSDFSLFPLSRRENQEN